MKAFRVSRPVAAVALLAVGIVAWQLLNGQRELPDAAVRAVVVLVVAVLVDAVILPLARVALGPARQRDPDAE